VDDSLNPLGNGQTPKRQLFHLRWCVSHHHLPLVSLRLGGSSARKMLDAEAVELDLVDPALAGRDLLDRRRQRGFNESGKRCLDTQRRRFLALKCRLYSRTQNRIQARAGGIVPIT
jgi:hypothetical protein